MKKAISFIINPLSGGKNKEHIPQLIKSIIDADKYDIDIDLILAKNQQVAYSSCTKPKKGCSSTSTTKAAIIASQLERFFRIIEVGEL